MPDTQKTLVLIDGLNNVYRCYYAIRGLTNSSGLATNAIYGFITMLRKILREQSPDAVAVAFDIGRTFRHEQYVDYKKDRKPMPDDLVVQIPFVYEVCEAFGLPILTMEGYEADDLMGSLACRARDAGYRVLLATSDKDFFQLVGNGIQLYHTGRDAVYDETAAREAFGVAPSQVADVMAIWGDAIDNIPGVPGIGEKGAKALIGEFGSLDALYANLTAVKKASQRQALETHREQAYLSRELATIRCDLDISVDLENLTLKEPDRSRLHDLFAKLEFHSLLQEYMPAQQPVVREYSVSTAPADLRALAESGKTLVVRFEPELEGFSAPVAVAVSTEPKKATIFPLSESLGATPELREELRRVLVSGLTFAAHDMKRELRLLEIGGWPLPEKFDDSMIMSYVLNPGAYAHSLENVSRERLRRDVSTRKDLGRGAVPLTLDMPGRDYIGERADVAASILEIVAHELNLDASLADIYRRVELPLIPILAKMEQRGIRIDVPMLQEMSATMGAQLADLEKRIYAEAGGEFNINSPSQLAFILFEKLQYPALKKTQKTKSASTGMEVLSQLAELGYAVPKLILEHRELHKLKSTYIDALPQLVGSDGRVHTTFNQAVAATGRLSSSDPNLQNIPIRTAQGREIRRAFIADQGNVLISADYSQIELRVLAHMTKDEGLIDVFTRGADIHRATAAKMFGVREEEVTHDQRRAAKTINFGVLYGMSAFRLSNELGISGAEAKEFIESYFSRYPKIRQYLDATLEDARSSGKVTTLFGRVRYIPEIHNRSWTVRGNAERMATNAPIQGTAADLLKLAMIALDRRLTTEAPDCAMLLTVHDEIVLEAPESRAEEATAIVRSAMESIHPLAVPLAVETHWGKSWYEAKD